MLPKALQDLIEELSRLPGVGPRTAERLATFILRAPVVQAQALAVALEKLHGSIQICSRCHNLAEAKLCAICQSGKRDEAVIAVVEDALDVIALERTGLFHGLYHVLGGAISPIEGIGPDQLNIGNLLKRVKQGRVEELIIATNATTEGEATAMYIQKQLPGRVKVTRLARGLPMGSDLEYADPITLGRALEGRQSL